MDRKKDEAVPVAAHVGSAEDAIDSVTEKVKQQFPFARVRVVHVTREEWLAFCEKDRAIETKRNALAAAFRTASASDVDGRAPASPEEEPKP